MTVIADQALRYGACLSPDGTWAATSRSDAGEITLELWHGPVARRTGIAMEPTDQLLALSGHRLLILSSQGQSHSVYQAHVHPEAEPALTRVADFTGRAVRLIAPSCVDSPPWTLSYDGTGTTLARLGETAGVTLPGAYTGGVWIGRLLALGRSIDGGPTTAVTADPETGEVRVLFEVGPKTNDEVQLHSASTGLTVVKTDAGGVERLGCSLDGSSWVFPDELAAPTGLIDGVALDPSGTAILAHLRSGVRSRLLRYDTSTKDSEWLVLPDGSLSGTPRWTGAGLTVPWCGPGVPLDLIDPESPPAWPTSAKVVIVPGAAGPIEAIAYGGEDWLHKPKLVIALHGGPLSAWRLTHDPFLEQLSSADTAVLAINQRGSLGYGYAHAAAIRGGWGSGDLADVTAVAGHLSAARGTRAGLALLGASYGAHLALLAACTSPELVETCVALSPFSSAPRLHALAGPGVRRMIEQTGGLTAPEGQSAPHDLLALAPRARARILIVQGRYDENVPLAHVSELAAALSRAPQARVRYAEIPDAGHDLNWPHVWDLVCHFIDKEP